MAFGHNNVTVGTTPTLLGRPTNSVYIFNSDAAAIFVGGADVTTSGARRGLSVALTNGTLQINNINGPIYAISAAGTSANAVQVLFS
jgi:hypothetical protein